jgi:hypothetical protein
MEGDDVSVCRFPQVDSPAERLRVILGAASTVEDGDDPVEIAEFLIGRLGVFLRGERRWSRAEVLQEIGSAVGEGMPAPRMVSLQEPADGDPIVSLSLDSIADGAAWLGRYGVKARTEDHHDKWWLRHDYTIWHGWSLGVHACEPLDGAS